MKRQAGFTIIELVMVIVILGILSAFALPRFADLGSEARTASLNGLAGALKSAASIAHAEQLVTGGTLGTTVTLEGQAVTMVNGYPTANAAGIVAAAAVDVNDYPVSGGGTAGGSTVTFTLQASCTVTYTAATAAVDNTPPLTASYVVAVTSSGC
jgi:MSHA pilin protein MshA